MEVRERTDLILRYELLVSKLSPLSSITKYEKALLEALDSIIAQYTKTTNKYTRQQLSNSAVKIEQALSSPNVKKAIKELSKTLDRDLLPIEDLLLGSIIEDMVDMAGFTDKELYERIFGHVNKKAVDWAQKIDRFTMIQGYPLETLVKNNTQYMMSKVSHILSQSLIQGWGSDKTYRELKKTVGKQVSNISNTTINTAMQTARDESRDEAYKELEKDVGVDHYTYNACLCASTCIVCASLDGKEYKMKFEDIPPAQKPRVHFNCRCQLVPITTEDGDPAERAYKQGMGENISYKEWFSRQKEPFQKKYLGAERYELYVQGADLDQFADWESGRKLSVDQVKQFMDMRTTATIEATVGVNHVSTQGNYIRVYHGRKTDMGDYYEDQFFTNKPDYANQYAGEDTRYYPNRKNPDGTVGYSEKYFTTGGRIASTDILLSRDELRIVTKAETKHDPEIEKILIAQAKEDGFKGLIIQYDGGKREDYVVFDPEDVRSSYEKDLTLFEKLVDSSPEARVDYENKHVKVVEDLMDKYDLKGEVDVSYGAYDGQTNPNIQIYFKTNSDHKGGIEEADQINAMLSEFGIATDQDSVGWYTTKYKKGGENAVLFNISEELTKDEFDEFYLKLIERDGSLGINMKGERIEIKTYGDTSMEDIEAIISDVLDETNDMNYKAKEGTFKRFTSDGDDKAGAFIEYDQYEDKIVYLEEKEPGKYVKTYYMPTPPYEKVDYNADEVVDTIQVQFEENYEHREALDLMRQGRDLNEIPLDFDVITGEEFPDDLVKAKDTVTLDAFESLSRYNKTETMYAVDQDGKVFGIEKGDSVSVDLPTSWRDKLDNMTVSHNHPSGVHPLSYGDIGMFVSENLKEMRAVSGDYIYTIKTTGSFDRVNFYSDMYELQKTWINDMYEKSIEIKGEPGTAQHELYLRLLDDEVQLSKYFKRQQTVSRRYGLDYTRERFIR